VELKTSAEIRGPGDLEAFHRKLMKYWIQSFLLGVPKIIVGFRTRDGVLVDIQEIETHKIPETVNSGPNPSWNADMCVNFAAAFLDCKLPYLGCGLLVGLADSSYRAAGNNQRRGCLENTSTAAISDNRGGQGGGNRSW
jgi:hypothetical protein